MRFSVDLPEQVKSPFERLIRFLLFSEILKFLIQLFSAVKGGVGINPV